MSLLRNASQIRSHIDKLSEFVKRAEGRLVILTGAGVSTDSGVPDYRGPRGIYVKNKDYKPIRYQEFISSHPTRQRYWSRSFLGYPRIASAKPNTTHHAIHKLSTNGFMNGLITQNVDGLHRGEDVIEMHGTLHKVHCLSCNHTLPRSEYQSLLVSLNPALVDWVRRNPLAGEGDVASSTEVRPDGDIETTYDYSTFTYPSCHNCGTGIYKPSVIFFGENIHPGVRDEVFGMVDGSRALLCVGTSLTVYSAFRLVLRAKEGRRPVGVVSLGETRADGIVDLKVEEGCGAVMEGIVERLGYT